MMPLLVAVLVFVLAGLAATLLLRRRGGGAGVDERQQGIAYLSSLHWRDLARLVLQAMEARGYQPVLEDGMQAGTLPNDGGDSMLQRGNQRVLLSSKYGSAAMVGTLAIKTVIKAKELRGADSAIVVSTGHFDEEAERLAKNQLVELVDGEELWREVKPFVPADALAKSKPASAGAMGPMLAWLGAAALGGVAWLFVQGMGTATAPSSATDAAATPQAAAQTKPATTPASKPGGAATAGAAAQPSAKATATTIPTDEAELFARRLDVASAISTLAGVDRAVWSTQSTLLVYLTSDSADPSTALCPLLERYPELAASRVQLQPPPGSTAAVRFKQCRAY